MQQITTKTCQQEAVANATERVNYRSENPEVSVLTENPWLGFPFISPNHTRVF